MDWILYALFGALITVAVLYYVIYGAVIAALRQYRRERQVEVKRPSPDAG